MLTQLRAGKIRARWTLLLSVAAIIFSCAKTELGSDFHPGINSATGILASLQFSTPAVTPVTTDEAHTVVVKAYDADLQILANDSTSLVTLQAFSTTNCTGAPVASSLSPSAVFLAAGVATFTNLQITKVAAKSVQVASGTVTACSAVLSVTPGVPASVLATAGTGQTGSVAAALGTAFSATVLDAHGNAIPGVTIDWTIAAGGGSISVGTNPTNSVGVSTATLTLGAASGVNSAKATVHTDATVFVSINALGCSFPLAGIAASSAAYSVRRLTANYTGPLLRLRRSSDNSEQDFTNSSSACSLDTAAVLTFAGTGSAYVKTWYDQSGGGKDVTQAGAANQPRIVNAGTLDTQNGLPAVIFDGANSKLATSANVGVSGTSTSISLVTTNSTATGIQEPLAWSGSEVVLHYPANGNLSLMPPYTLTQGSIANRGTGIRANTFVNSAGLSKAFQNGALGTNGTSVTAVDGILALGWSQPQATYYWNGSIQEAVVFASTLSDAHRMALEADQLATYKILPLDGMPLAAAVYSLRRMLTAYTGSLIQVRRSNDSATQDIGYNSANDLDTAALTAFCTTNSCFVSKWYDQNNNVNDAIQATAANQPRIVNAGVTETSGGHPALNFTAAGQNLTVNVPVASFPVTVSLIADTGGASKGGALIKYGQSAGGAGGFAIGIGASGSNFDSPGTSVIGLKENIVWCPSSPNTNFPATPFSLTTTQQNAAGGDTLVTYLNRAAVVLGSSTTPAQVPAGPMYIGGYFSGIATNRYAQVKQSEVIVYGAALSTADRGSLETNQQIYYGLP